MNPINNKAEIIDHNIKKEFKYGAIIIMNLDISYPEIKIDHKPAVQKHINDAYRSTVSEFYKYVSTKLYNDALKYYKDTVKNGFPFHAYDVVMKYTVTLKDNCLLSTYFDRYEYTGGAHGNTIRFSDNWDLRTSYHINMKNLFKRSENHRILVLAQILKQADINYKENSYLYFENYQTLIVKNFNLRSFNLTPTGIAPYYQQYEIAPYVTGIVVFDISYESLGREKPSCV
jgi:hypothetical protein